MEVGVPKDCCDFDLQAEVSRLASVLTDQHRKCGWCAECSFQDRTDVARSKSFLLRNLHDRTGFARSEFVEPAEAAREAGDLDTVELLVAGRIEDELGGPLAMFGCQAAASSCAPSLQAVASR